MATTGPTPVRILGAILLAAAAMTAVATAEPCRLRRNRPPVRPAVRHQVPTTAGCVRGESVSKCINGIHFEYFAFRGIPYAVPPLGQLRFKGPRKAPLPSHHGCLVQRPGTKCVQNTVPGSVPVGEEDCLHLNVFVPGEGASEVSYGAKMPVLVYVHGGGFMYGSASHRENGPEFFMKRNNTILVTINYRLGALGFLNLENDDIPGNMGLKDQRAALQWVQDNIYNFGGDPERVTIFGNSAGAASVHYHTITTASKGLFRAAIMQSGNALASFAYQETHLENAARLSQVLTGNQNLSAVEMANVFRSATVDQIRTATMGVIQADPSLQLGLPPFCPSPERRPDGVEEKFLEQDPESLVRAPRVPPVPTIMGITGEEGYFAYRFGQLDKKAATVAALKENPALLLPRNVVPYNDTAKLLGVRDLDLLPQSAAVISQRLRSEYGLDQEGSDNHFISLLGDLFTVVATHRLVNLTLDSQANPQNPLYLYHFLEDGEYNWGKVSFNILDEGATHTDELGYLMRIDSPRDLGQSLDGRTDSSKWLSLLTTMWTDFAHGKSLEDYSWPRARGLASEAAYAQLSSSSWTSRKPCRGLGGPRMRLWDEVFSAFRQ